MAKRIGVACIILGIVCMLGAVGFVLYNQWESENAAQSSQSMLLDVQSLITQKKQEVQQPLPQINPPQTPTQTPATEPTAPTEVATVRLNGYNCIGILSIPVLEMEWPVLTDWSYVKLKKAPCVYYGSYLERDFVIAAHNYKSHFGSLPQLQAGDLVIFTDVNGNEYYYEVALLETLPYNATQEMITSGFDLSLYTCTPGGASRVTVRCDAIHQ